MLRKLAAEGLGTALLLATIVGSGIMAAKLAGGNTAIALLGNTIPTGAILVVLISTLGPISGAHFNPLVISRLTRQPLNDCKRGSRLHRRTIHRCNSGHHHRPCHVRSAPAAGLDHHAQRHGPMACRGRSQFWPAHSNFSKCPECPATGGHECRPLHHRRLLVHRVHQLCQSRRHLGAFIFRYFRRHKT